MNIPRPRRSYSIATIWAIDEFTADNGATVVIPGSHQWGNEFPNRASTIIPCVMPAGSVVVFLSTLWHGGGANVSKAPRLAITTQYCEPVTMLQTTGPHLFFFVFRHPLCYLCVF
jgi:ectoine hydroxylase-related dioxygenase (phytanoyl-CoA dioxygenase family)